MAAQIDSGVDTDQLISLKVPVALPYYTNSNEFQYINGEVQIEGIVYQYVKRRIFNDSIEYLCLKDAHKTRLLSAREQFYQLAYDLQVNKHKSSNHPTTIKPLLLEYCQSDRNFSLQAFTLPRQKKPVFYLCPLPQLFDSAPVKPPEPHPCFSELS